MHRLEGLRQFLERDEGAAQAHFAVAKRLDGAYTWPTSLLPARHQVREVYDAAVEQGASAELAAPAAGALYLDGQADRIRVDGSPTVFQHLGGDAAQTVFVGPSQALPEYALPAPPAPEPIPAPVVSTTTHKARPPVAGVSLVASGVVLGAVAGVQFARSRAGYTEYLDAFDQDPLAAEASFQRTVASPRNQAAGFGAGAAVLLGAGGVLFARGIHVEGRF
ncbi:MAG: hypothetical protein EP330_22065 [Deltaproteobacteria bacterium]|nr:MAG: hypothetical protein EP330_22065 [Deltaproteobacteria bacterium]